MRGFRTRALLLRSVDYAEADRVFTFFTEEMGNISAFARAARRRRRLAAEPLSVLEIDVTQTRGELFSLREVHLVQVYHGILRDLGKMLLASALLETVRIGAPPHQADGALFSEIITQLTCLDSANTSACLGSLVAFELRLLSHLGFAPGLERCASCNKPAPYNRAALFDPERGSIICRACGGASFCLSGATRAFMRDAQVNLALQPPETTFAQEAYRVLRALLETKLEKGLPSLRLFERHLSHAAHRQPYTPAHAS